MGNRFPYPLWIKIPTAMTWILMLIPPLFFWTKLPYPLPVIGISWVGGETSPWYLLLALPALAIIYLATIAKDVEEFEFYSPFDRKRLWILNGFNWCLIVFGYLVTFKGNFIDLTERRERFLFAKINGFFWENMALNVILFWAIAYIFHRYHVRKNNKKEKEKIKIKLKIWQAEGYDVSRISF